MIGVEETSKKSEKIKPTFLANGAILSSNSRVTESLFGILLVTLVRCIVNCTAYPIQALCGPFTHKQATSVSKGLWMAFF